MARALRNEEPGAFYHVGSRGNNGRPLYLDDVDRHFFLLLFARTTRKYGWIVYAYCLMTNHYHAVFQIPDGGLSAGMQELNTGHSRRTNRRYGDRDHLFKNRFFSVRLETEEHLLTALRYTVLNPVAAGLCARPGDWPWSSYRACAGFEHAPSFLAVDRVLSLFSASPGAARQLYRTFVETGPIQLAPGPVLDTVTEV